MICPSASAAGGPRRIATPRAAGGGGRASTADGIASHRNLRASGVAPPRAASFTRRPSGPRAAAASDV